MTARTRRGLAISLALFKLMLAGPGCDCLNLRKAHHDTDAAVTKAAHTTETAAESSDTDKILDVSTDGTRQKPFFSGSRMQGGLSDEAREIESHMGVK